MSAVECQDCDYWVFPCVDPRGARPVFFTVGAKKGRYRIEDIFDDVVAWLKKEHGLEYIADGSGWARAGTSQIKYWGEDELS